MKDLIVILDAGHGGVIGGTYQTAGKRSPIYSNGCQLFEGVFNRAIVNGIAKQLDEAGILCEILVPEQSDIPLSTRVKRANDYARQLPNYQCLLVSVHANAGGETGFEVYTYPGESKSDVAAEFIAKAFSVEFPGQKLRADYSDGDADKEAPFYILKHTAMPAVLTENFFMDNEKDCVNILMSTEGCNGIIKFHVDAIKEYHRHVKG